ncbi:MAG TPA: hypothetical protein VMU69_10450 [Bradyrhizobium sp.]|nr:hypothetical protein [Bradyrhizobium sp.]
MKETIQGSKSRPTKGIEIAKKPAHKNRIHILGATRRMLSGYQIGKAEKQGGNVIT